MSSFSIDTTKAWAQVYAQVLEENREYFIELDLAVGDAGHGADMACGMNATVEPANLDQPDLATLFKKVGLALAPKVGGAAGPLYGTFFMRAAKETRGAGNLDAVGLSRVLHAGLRGALDHGKAELQDKAMVDAITSASEVFDAVAAAGLTAAATAAGKAVRASAEATIPLLARKGRASYLGERLVGHQDPGTTSSAYFFETLARVVS